MTNVKIDEQGHCKVKLQIEIPSEEIQKEIEDIYRELSKSAKVPGFRSGKVPRKILEARYKDYVFEETQKKVISKGYQDAIKQKNLNPVNIPKIDNVTYDEDKPLSFSAEVEIAPEVGVKNYTGIKLKVNKIKIEDIEVEDYLEKLRESHATLENVEDRPLVKGDYAIIDYSIVSDEGDKVEEGKSKLMLLQPEGVFIADIINDMEGMNIGEIKNVSTILPDNYYKKEFSGHKVSIEIGLKEIKEKMLPELNDEFAKSLGKFETVGELKEQIIKVITEQKKSDQKKEGKAQIGDYLLDQYEFELPQSVMDLEKRSVLRERQITLKEGDKIPAEVIAEAKNRVKLSYILAEVAEKENIKVESKEIESTVRHTAYSLNVSYEKLRDHLVETGGIYGVQERILQEKVLDYLFDNSKVVEK